MRRQKSVVLPVAAIIEPIRLADGAFNALRSASIPPPTTCRAHASWRNQVEGWFSGHQHPGHYLTWKLKAKTLTVYVLVDLLPQVKQYNGGVSGRVFPGADG